MDSDNSSVADIIEDAFSSLASLPAASPNPTPAEPSSAKPSTGRGVSHQQPCPVFSTDSLLAELWAACLGHCEEWQLQIIPQHATGLPTEFCAHPMRFINHKVQARIQKRRSRKTANKATKRRQRFYVNFGFLRASTSNYSKPNPESDRIISSINRIYQLPTCGQ